MLHSYRAGHHMQAAVTPQGRGWTHHCCCRGHAKGCSKCRTATQPLDLCLTRSMKPSLDASKYVKASSAWSRHGRKALEFMQQKLFCYKLRLRTHQQPLTHQPKAFTPSLPKPK